MAFLAPLALAAGTGGAGYLGGRLAQKLGDLVGFQKGGSLAPKAMSKALNSATVKKTGTRIVKKNQLVIPKHLANQLKKVAKRKPTVMKKPKQRHRKRKK
jgi:hypothetical protein